MTDKSEPTLIIVDPLELFKLTIYANTWEQIIAPLIPLKLLFHIFKSKFSKLPNCFLLIF